MKDARHLEARLTILATVFFGLILAGFDLVVLRNSPTLAHRPLLAAGVAGVALVALGSWALSRQLSGSLRAREAALLHAALHDPETGLPNRTGLERWLPGMKGATPVFVVAFGVERYAQMRGVLGHEHCARMQRRLATALAAHQPNWLIARPAADIIAAAFVAPDLATAKRLAAAAGERLQGAGVGDPQGAVDVRVVTGLSTGSENPTAALVKEADLALDAARARRVRATVFDKAASAHSADTLALMAGLRDAIAAGDLSLVHQPKLCLRTGAITGVESLVRWTDPQRGAVSPDRFIALAEETGDIRALTEWVLARAMEDQAQMTAAGHPVMVSVNLSGRMVGDASFTKAILSSGRVSGRLCLEVTETAVIARPEGALAQFRRFRENGVKIAIDDYGSGLSSLAYLKSIEADELKIDKSLVTALPTSPRDAILVRSTVDLAHNLGMTATAEGVEDKATCSLLGVIGCDHVQGWHIGRPMPVAELVRFLTTASAKGEAAFA